MKRARQSHTSTCEFLIQASPPTCSTCMRRSSPRSSAAATSSFASRPAVSAQALRSVPPSSRPSPELASLNAGSMNFGLFQIVGEIPVAAVPVGGQAPGGDGRYGFREHVSTGFSASSARCSEGTTPNPNSRSTTGSQQRGLLGGRRTARQAGQAAVCARHPRGAPASVENLSLLVREAEQRLGDVRVVGMRRGTSPKCRYALPAFSSGATCGSDSKTICISAKASWRRATATRGQDRRGSPRVGS